MRPVAAPSGLTSAHLHHPPHIFLWAGCPSGGAVTRNVSEYMLVLALCLVVSSGLIPIYLGLSLYKRAYESTGARKALIFTEKQPNKYETKY